MYCTEPLKYPFRTLVHHLSTGGHIVDASQALYYMALSTYQPICIYIKEIRLHNNKREKSGQRFVTEKLS